MRITEINKALIEGIIGNLQVGNYNLQVDDHFIQRTAERLVRPSDIDVMLKKLNTVSNELDALPQHEPFWLVDKTLNVGMAMRKKDDTTYLLKTVVHTKNDPYSRGVTEYIYT